MKEPKYDPVYLHATREAWVILGLFAVLLVWAMGVYYFDGYDPEATKTSVAIVLGMPRWVFWGIFAPWCFSILCTVAFVFFFMKDDDLGESLDDEAGDNNEAVQP